MRVHFVEAQLARAIQRGKPNSADPRIELRDARAFRDLLTHMGDDAFSDFEVVLAECAGRVVDGGRAELLDDGGRAVRVDESRPENRVGPLGVRVEPEAVDVAAEALPNEIDALREGLRGFAVADEDDLR